MRSTPAPAGRSTIKLDTVDEPFSSDEDTNGHEGSAKDKGTGGGPESVQPTSAGSAVGGTSGEPTDGGMEEDKLEGADVEYKPPQSPSRSFDIISKNDPAIV